MPPQKTPKALDVTSGPATRAANITPHNTTDLPQPTRGIYVGISGDISVVMGGATVIFTNVPVGIIPLSVTRVNATGTDADELRALW